MAIPRGLVDIEQLKRACTIAYQPMGEPEPFHLETWKLDKDYIYVPRQLGLDVCRREGIEYDDQTSGGVPVTFSIIPEPRDYQVDALTKVEQTMDSYYDFLFRARTGWGKTIGSLIVAARRGVSTLVIVDQENLKDQWIKALKEHFGMTDANIGIIQGKVLKFKGCPVTIAMVHTLSQKRMPQEVYDHFGLMLVDETHVIGAPTFSVVLMEFSAGYRIGVSATPKRKDGLQKVLDYNLGKVRVYIDDEHDENSVFVMEHDTVYSWYANISPKVGRFINEVSEDGSRNLLIAETTAQLYVTGRDVLVLSDRIEHLKHLMVLCEYLGVPGEEMGLYAGYNPVFAYAKDPSPQRRPFGYVRGQEYTPISLQLIAKRTKKPTLEGIKENAKVIFATYGMFAKGVDVPRLNGGVDATPRGSAEQVHGRILRKVDGKLRSIWVTIADTSSYRSLHGLVQRIGDYVKNNAAIFKWQPDTEEIPCDHRALKAELREEVNRLKSMRIETSSDGVNTLLTQSDQVTLAKQRVNAIKAITRRPGASRTASSPGASTGRSPPRRSTPLPHERRSPSPKPPRR